MRTSVLKLFEPSFGSELLCTRGTIGRNKEGKPVEQLPIFVRGNHNSGH